MKTLSKVLALGAMLCAPTLAFADSIGQISAGGGNTFTNTTITFTGPFITTGDIGVFSPLEGGTITFMTGPLDYTIAGSHPGVYIFTVTKGTQSAMFYETSDTYSLGTYTNGNTGTANLSLLINGVGYFTSNFFSGQAPGAFTITSQGEPAPNGDSVQVTFSGTGTATSTAVTPEPNSLLLLGTGLLGMGGLLTVRSRKNATL